MKHHLLKPLFLVASARAKRRDKSSAGSAQVVLTGGQVILTSDTCYKVTCTGHRDSWVLSGVDEQKTLDWEMRINPIQDIRIV